MAKNALDRDLETREMAERPKAWTPPTVLPKVNMDPDYNYRWVRVATRGKTDATNVSSKLREGWEPCLAKDHPEIFSSDCELERFAENVVIGGLMLCKAPRELVEQRTRYYAAQTRAQIEAVDNNLMRQSDARMPIFNERKSKVTFGSGN